METVLGFGCFARVLDSNKSANTISQQELVQLLVKRIDANHPVCNKSSTDRSLINNIIKGRKAFTPILNSDLPSVEEVSKTIDTISDCFDDGGKKRILSSLYKLIRHDILYDFETKESFIRFFGMRRRDFLSQPLLYFNRTCAEVLLYTTCARINKDKAMTFLSSFNDTEFMQFQINAVELYADNWYKDGFLRIKIPEPLILDREYLEDFLSLPNNPKVKKVFENLPTSDLDEELIDDCIEISENLTNLFKRIKSANHKPKSQ